MQLGDANADSSRSFAFYAYVYERRLILYSVCAHAHIRTLHVVLLRRRKGAYYDAAFIRDANVYNEYHEYGSFRYCIYLYPLQWFGLDVMSSALFLLSLTMPVFKLAHHPHDSGSLTSIVSTPSQSHWRRNNTCFSRLFTRIVVSYEQREK